MATKRPSFLKRQKELRRKERALEKREAKRGRKELRAIPGDTAASADRSDGGTEVYADGDA